VFRLHVRGDIHSMDPTCRVVRCAPSNQCLNLTQNSWVSYPGLPDHPYHAIAVKQFRKDTFGGVLSFGVKGDPEVGAKVVVEAG
jgi:O-acetylhomoserine/O-acetylserine sulfhydrylase-like pyridoxal-dependent enzyme